MSSDQYYIECNLKDNPFRTNALEGETRAGIWVGYPNQKKDIIKLLEKSSADNVGNVNFVILFGDYGTGKTHALTWIKNYVSNEKKAEFDCSCYLIPTLRGGKGGLSFSSAIHDVLFLRSNICEEIASLVTFLDDKAAICRREERLPDDVPIDKIYEKLIPQYELNQFAKALRSHYQNRNDLLSFLWPPKNGLSDIDSVRLLSRIINLFVNEIKIGNSKYRFKKGFYFLIDELDDLLRASEDAVLLINDCLRILYDSCPNCFGLWLGISAELGALDSALDPQYIQSRFTKKILFDFMDHPTGVAFVKELLNSARINPADKTKTDFYPFEKQAIEEIISQIPDLTARKLVNYMQIILEEARLNSLPNSKKKAISIQDLDDAGIVDDVLRQQ